MVANILIPLDGSALSERALPFAVSLARASDARLWLVHALPAMPPLLNREPGLDVAATIEGRAAHLRERGLKATAHTIHGDATNAVLDASVDMPADLIAGPTAHPFLWSSALTACVFFAVGAAKSRFVDQPWHQSGLETLAMGSAASILAYGVGYVLKQVTGITV